jgi:two-component system nitrate/nitrite response regulator NarL
MTTLIVADDHPLMRDAVAGLFGPPYQVVERCSDGLMARAAILAYAPDVAVLDVRMPSLTGLDLLRQARAEGWRTKMVLLTAGLEPKPLVEAVKLKVDGLVLKDAGGELLLRCVEAVLAGEQWIDKEAMKQVMSTLAQPAAADLTPRESDVVRQVAHGQRNKEIARSLGITEGTVKMHLHNLYEKLGVASRTELALLAKDHGLD